MGSIGISKYGGEVGDSVGRADIGEGVVEVKAREVFLYSNEGFVELVLLPQGVVRYELVAGARAEDRKRRGESAEQSEMQYHVNNRDQ